MALRIRRRPPAPVGDAAVAHALTLDSVTRSHRRRGKDFHALENVSLVVPEGSFLAVMGLSGSGKTTFLQCAAGLDQPTSGTVRIGHTDLSRLSEAALTRLRRDRIGFVFQSLNLVPSLTVGENTALPLLLRGMNPQDPAVRAGVDGVGGRRSRRPRGRLPAPVRRSAPAGPSMRRASPRLTRRSRPRRGPPRIR
ncbi:putative ABC transport system ATP-binding protein [Streptomyces sp. 2131.1]|nr:putative ABC transport system ATP-binding protein [Streptomyces sp. 2131.1]